MQLMLKDENVAHEVSKPTHRKALDDVTNRTRKRSFSLVSADSSHPSSKKGNDAKYEDFHLTKQVCLGIENSVAVKSDCETDCNMHDNLVSLPSTKHDLGLSTVYRTCGKSHISNVANNKCGVLETTCANCASGSLMKVCSGVCEPIVSLPASSEPLNAAEIHFEEAGLTDGISGVRTFSVSDGLVTLAYDNNDRELGEAIECSKHTGSQNSKFPVLERCTGLKDQGNEVTGLGPLDSCFCSFCLKAAHIWSDLHYQDTKGRITALKKSQKEANALVQNISGEMEALIVDQGTSSRSSKLEFNLMDHWRTLFLHMGHVLAHESNRLEESCHALKDIRDNCKLDMEMINKELSNNL